MLNSFLLIAISLFLKVYSQDFNVPAATLIAYTPKGLEVSIPDEDGIELFAFHGSVNKELIYPAPGDMSVDIRKPKNGRWTYKNPNIKLKVGDVINYWLYVQVGGRGYPDEDLTWRVATLVDRNTVTTSPVTVPTTSCNPTMTTVNGATSCQGKLIFEETFDGLDRSKWQNVVQFGGDPDYPFVVYSSNEGNSFVRNGNLHIKPTLLNENTVTSGSLHLSGCTGSTQKQECDAQAQAQGGIFIPPVETAQLRTKQSFNFRYGRVEVRAKLPIGDWLYSEIQLKPTNSVYGSDPKLASGQINFALSRGNRECTSNGQEMGARILEGYCEMSFNNQHHREKFHKRGTGLWADEFHTYGLLWTPDNITFSVDGTETGRVVPPADGFKSISAFNQFSYVPWSRGSKIAPFDQEFYLSLGLAAAGFTEFPDNAISQNNKKKPWKNGGARASATFWNDRNNWYPTWSGDSSIMQVDYVKVWAI